MVRLVHILLGSLLAVPAFVAAQDLLPPKVTATVKRVDLDKGTITVRLQRKGAMEDATLNLLKKDIDVTGPDGQKTRLDVVVPGRTVQLRIAPTGDVEAITVPAPTLLATVLDVDPERRTVTVARPDDPPATLPVAADARVVITGRTAFLREIKPGSQMTLTTSLDGATVVGLDLVADPDGKLATKLYPRIKTSRLPGVRFVGLIDEVDAARRYVRLAGPKTKGTPRTMPVARDAVIQVVYGQVPMQVVALGQVVQPVHATALVSPESQEVTRLLVEPPAVRAQVKALDGDGGRLTVAVDGAEKTFVLPRGVKVLDKTRVKRLGDVQRDATVSLVLTLDRQQLLAIDVGPSLRP